MKFLIPALALPYFMGQCAIVHAQNAQTHTAPSLEKISQMLKEPLFPDYAAKATVKKVGKDKSGFENYTLSSRDVSAIEIPDSLSILSRGEGVEDFVLNLTKSDFEVQDEPDWEKLTLQVNDFVAKYFPGDQLQTSDDSFASHFHFNQESYSLSYAEVHEDVEVRKVEIGLNLGTGKISSITTTTLPLNGLVIPPAVKRDRIISSVSTTLDEKGAHLENIKIDSFERIRISRGNDPLKFTYSLALNGRGTNGVDMLVFGFFDEASGKFYVNNTRKSDIIPVKPGTKPTFNTHVVDVTPIWRPDGQSLIFNSTRDVKGRPWWQRTYDVTSIVSYPDLTMIRPLKSLGADYNTYELLAASTHFIAFKINQKGFAVLDTKGGQLYLPKRESAQTTATSLLPPSVLKRLNDNFEFDVAGASWLQDESGLVVSVYLDPMDRNLYLMRRPPGAAPQAWTISPIVKEAGEDLLPCLSTDNKQLSWVHQVGQTVPPKTNTPPQWELNVADYDLKAGSVSKRLNLRLSSTPLSLSYDKIKNRWLVSTTTSLLWVQEIKGDLVATPVSALKWGDTLLKPLGASVSPSGGRIAVAAQLDRPQFFDKTHGVVESLVFEWDGKSQQVKPFLEPSLNGLPRYVFPEANTPWAKVRGDVQKFNLAGFVDPSTIENSR